MISSTSIVRPSVCWVMHKTWHMLTQNCLGAVLTMFTFAGGLLVICRQGGDHPHSEERTKLIYDQEYEELVHQLENMLDLTLESPSYSMVPTSLVNLDIVLPHQEFRKHRGLPELPLGCGPEQREYTMDRARGLVDLDWSQWTPIFHPDDIDRDPQFNKYPYPDDNLDYDDEEEMETDYQNAPPGGTSDTRVAPLASAGHHCYRPPATYSRLMTQGQTPGSPRSTHTDTDTAMEMGLSQRPRHTSCTSKSQGSDRPRIYVHPGIGCHSCSRGRGSCNRDIGTVRPASK